MEDTDYAFGRSRAEYDRLIEQAELFRPLTERVLLAAGISRGMHVLDVGCGLGDVSFLVAGMVGPENSVVGVDLDTEALSSRRSDAPQRRPQTSSAPIGSALTRYHRAAHRCCGRTFRAHVHARSD